LGIPAIVGCKDTTLRLKTGVGYVSMADEGVRRSLARLERVVPMTEMVRSFSELIIAERPAAGGKGKVLGQLYQAGFPVPDGFVVLPSAFDGDDLRMEAWTQVQSQLERLRGKSGNTAFAVRSSALAEDSAQASFAGEFETVLDVHSDEEIRKAIQMVRRSRRSERVRAYTRAKGMEADHEVAIVVQQLIAADVSGVLFTTDPITGSRAKMTGSFVHGLGDRLVSGSATGEAFTLGRPRGQYQGPAELQRYARRLYKLATRLEKELGHPQDIEWAFAEGKLYVLQSRPITTLIGYNPATGEWNDSLSGDYLWSNVNFGEAVTDVMTPLSWTVLQLIFGEYAILPGYDNSGNIGGRPYLNTSVFASVFQAVGKSRQDLLKALEGTLYMNLPEEMEIPVIPLSKWSLLSILPCWIRLRMKEWRGVKNLSVYLASNPTWCSLIRDKIQEVGTKAELIELWHEKIRPHVTGSVWNVMGSVSSSTAYTMRLRRELNELVGRDDADVLISNLSGSSGLLASLGPVVGIARVVHGQMNREVYLEQYGHRGPHEFELSVPRPAEEPDWVDEQLAQFRKHPVDAEALLAKQRTEFDAAWERFKVRYPHKAKAMRLRIDETARHTRMRESARSEYVRDRWVVRAFALRAGELTGLEDDIFFLTIDEVLDVLSGDEAAIPSIPARKETYKRYKALPPYPSIILGRFDPFQWAADPKRRCDVFNAHAPLREEATEIGSANIILGSPGAAGLVEAVVRRLDRPEDADQLQEGEVLVTMWTDIAWTLLFPRAAAIVTDVGAPLSHAAIVARELGIPAVVGCGNATTRLKTGDRVLVNGGRGTVEIIDAAQVVTS
jgi:phosphohistidine swiveling domain-containing protein